MKSYFDIASDGGSDILGQVGAQQERLKERLEGIRHIVAVMSGKGGVGKSLLTVTLAAALARAGRKTGIVDADINGASLVEMTGVTTKTSGAGGTFKPPSSIDGVQLMSIDLFLGEGDAVQWDAPTQSSAYTWRRMVEVAAVREMLADTEWDPLDILFIDLPPGTDKLPDLLDLLPMLSAAIVVTVPSRASAYVVRKSIAVARKHYGNGPIWLIENMSAFVCDGCGKVHRLFSMDNSIDLMNDSMVSLLGRIPFDSRLTEQIDSGKPFLENHADCPAALAIENVASRLYEKLESSLSDTRIPEEMS